MTAGFRSRSRAGPEPPPTAEIPPALRHVFRWDLDKTYLKTDFDSLRALVRTARQSAAEKQAVPGAAALLRELRSSGPDGAHRICFVSGSPRQMRSVLTEKLRLDGVEFDEFVLKPNLSNFLRGRFRAMRDQVGYKLPALLAARSEIAPAVRETLFGDDAESDAVIYSLYVDLLTGAVSADDLGRLLKKSRAYPDDQERTLQLARALQTSTAEHRIVILLDRHSPPARFDAFGARLVPVFNYFQAALVLVNDEVLDARGALRVAMAMLAQFEYTPDALGNATQDLVRRGRVPAETAAALAADLEGHLPALDPAPAVRESLRALAPRLAAAAQTRTAHPPGEPAIDYERLIGEHRKKT